MCGCLKPQHQVNVAHGAHAVVVAHQQPARALPHDFDGHTHTGPTAARMILDDVNERTVGVLTSLNPDEDDFTPLDEKHSHQCYFGPTTWIVADVFKPPTANYGLNQAVLRQFELADASRPGGIVPSAAPTLIIIKHCINPDTAAYLKRTIPGDSTALQDVPMHAFLTTTTFGKFVVRLLPSLGAGNGAVVRVQYRAQSEDIHATIQYG